MAVAVLAGGLVMMVLALAVVGLIVALRYAWPLLLPFSAAFLIYYIHRRRPGIMDRVHRWATSAGLRLQRFLPGWLVPIVAVRISIF